MANAMPHTIAYVIDDLGYGGAQKQLSLLARHLELPFKPVVICLSQIVEPFAADLEQAGVPVVTIERHSSAEIGRAWKLKRALDEIGASLVHGILDASNVYAFVAGRLRQIPVVLSLRAENIRVSGMRAHTVAWMMRHAEAVVTNTTAGRHFLAESVGVKNERIHLTPNWIDPAFSPSSAGTPDGKTFGSVGRFHVDKRFDMLVDALPLVRERIPDARLVLQGDGPERQALEARVEQQNLKNAVELIPAGSDVAPTLARLSCFALPSPSEGLSNAAVEALASGVPLVANRTGDMANLITPGETGIFAEAGDVPALATAIMNCLQDRALAASCRSAGPTLVAQQYSMTAGVERMATLYNSLLARG